VKVSAASPAECGELAVRTLDVDEAADLFSAEGLTASLRRAASFLCPASPRQVIDAVLEALRPLQPGGGLSREELANLLDLLISGGDLLELPQSGDVPGRLLYLGPPSYAAAARLRSASWTRPTTWFSGPARATTGRARSARWQTRPSRR
jgi:hypothetical protein